MFLFSTLFLLIALKGYEFAPDVSVDCPGNFTYNTVTNVTGSMDRSVLTTGPTGNCVFGVTAVNFYFSKGSITSILLCTQNFSTSTNICDQNFNAQGCVCDRYVGNMFYYTYQFTANKLEQNGGVIQMRPNCLNINSQYPLLETMCNITIVVPTTTTITTTTLTITPTTTPTPPFPRWCIAVIVIVIILVLVIVILVITIIKCKKEKRRGNRFHFCFYDIRKKEKGHCGFYPDDESASHNIYKFHCCFYDIRKNWTCPCGFYPDDESASHYIYKFHCCSHEKQKGACPCGFYPGDESSATSDGTIQTELKHTIPPPQSGKNRNKTKQTARL